MKLVDRLIEQRPNQIVYHYTSPAGLLGILKTKTLWATSHFHLNDTLEFSRATDLFRVELANASFNEPELKLFDSLTERMKQQFFVASFSEHDDLLSQWRAYCQNGTGYALGFAQDNPIFSSATDNAFNLIRCEYDSDEQQKLCRVLIAEFRDFLKSKADLNVSNLAQQAKSLRQIYNWTFAFALLTSSFKNKGFFEESEWRLVSQYPDDPKLVAKLEYRTGRLGLTPYFSLPLSAAPTAARFDRIVIGPAANKKVAELSLRTCLKTYGFGEVEIECSDTSFRQ